MNNNNEQKALMLEALSILAAIANADGLFKDFDDEYLADRNKSLQGKYDKIMGKLRETIKAKENTLY
jgi:hypothetical protein